MASGLLREDVVAVVLGAQVRVWWYPTSCGPTQMPLTYPCKQFSTREFGGRINSEKFAVTKIVIMCVPTGSLCVQWGDEGKGKLVDILAGDADFVCRCAGGNNAGHTVCVGAATYDFHILPSGIVTKEAMSIIGNGTVIHLKQFFDEIDHNVQIDTDSGTTAMNGWQDRLRVSDRAHIVLDLHQVGKLVSLW